MPSNVPTFIGIGMSNSGTRWLYDQLSSHADVWMPCQKELHFFDQGMRFESGRKRLYRMLNRRNRKIASVIDGDMERRTSILDLLSSQERFLFEYLFGASAKTRSTIEVTTQPHRNRELGAASVIENPGIGSKEFMDYSRLFSYHGFLCSGEITPAYACLHEDYVAEIGAALPWVRFVLIVRHPVERQLSAYRKLIRKEFVTRDTVFSVLSETELTPEFLECMDPANVADRWIKGAGEERVMVLRLTDLVASPSEARQDVARFVGIDSADESFGVPADYNRKKEKIDDDGLSERDIAWMRERLTAQFGVVAERYVRRFGGDW